MLLTEYLSEEAVYLDLSATEPEALLGEMVERLGRTCPLADPPALVEALVEREKLSTTGIGSGIAVPHCKSPQVEELVILVGRSPVGIDFKALDSKPVHLFFLLVAPMAAASTHLKALAKIARMAKQPEIINQLLSLEQPADLWAFLEAQDQKMD